MVPLNQQQDPARVLWVAGMVPFHWFNWWKMPQLDTRGSFCTFFLHPCPFWNTTAFSSAYTWSWQSPGILHPLLLKLVSWNSVVSQSYLFALLIIIIGLWYKVQSSHIHNQASFTVTNILGGCTDVCLLTLDRPQTLFQFLQESKWLVYFPVSCIWQFPFFHRLNPLGWSGLIWTRGYFLYQGSTLPDSRGIVLIIVWEPNTQSLWIAWNVHYKYIPVACGLSWFQMDTRRHRQWTSHRPILSPVLPSLFVRIWMVSWSI